VRVFIIKISKRLNSLHGRNEFLSRYGLIALPQIVSMANSVAPVNIIKGFYDIAVRYRENKEKKKRKVCEYECVVS